VRWAFDPLMRRNAYLNLHKLGATATSYLPGCYGTMTDGINLGDASDRIYLRWRLASPAAVAAAAGERVEVDQAAWCGAGAVVLLERAGDGTPEERPVPGGELPDDSRPVLVAVPADVEALRVRDRELAAAWRSAVRFTLYSALAAGY
jgi:predicted GNAT superfamily acetyltransferase